jgi:hypothetical protein
MMEVCGRCETTVKPKLKEPTKRNPSYLGLLIIVFNSSPKLSPPTTNSAAVPLAHQHTWQALPGPPPPSTFGFGSMQPCPFPSDPGELVIYALLFKQVVVTY